MRATPRPSRARPPQIDAFHGKWQYLFIETICTDEAILDQNYLHKLSYSPDYQGVTCEEVGAQACLATSHTASADWTHRPWRPRLPPFPQQRGAAWPSAGAAGLQAPHPQVRGGVRAGHQPEHPLHQAPGHVRAPWTQGGLALPASPAAAVASPHLYHVWAAPGAVRCRGLQGLASLSSRGAVCRG